MKINNEDTENLHYFYITAINGIRYYKEVRATLTVIGYGNIVMHLRLINRNCHTLEFGFTITGVFGAFGIIKTNEQISKEIEKKTANIQPYIDECWRRINKWLEKISKGEIIPEKGKFSQAVLDFINTQ